MPARVNPSLPVRLSIAVPAYSRGGAAIPGPTTGLACCVLRQRRLPIFMLEKRSRNLGSAAPPKSITTSCCRRPRAPATPPPPPPHHAAAMGVQKKTRKFAQMKRVIGETPSRYPSSNISSTDMTQARRTADCTPRRAHPLLSPSVTNTPM